MLPHNDNKSKVVIVLLIAASVWFLAAYLDKTVHTKLYFDAGWHATVAKNLAFGHGYASSYNGYRFFDPDVTMGPVPIGLASGAIALFGNTYFLPIYLISLLHLVLATSILVAVYRIAGRKSAIVLALSWSLLISYFEPGWWHNFTGDMSSMLWGILGLQLTVMGAQSGRHVMLLAAGLVLGIAVLSKVVGIVLVAGAGGYLLVSTFKSSAALVRNFLLLILGLMICLGPWQIYKAVSEATVSPQSADAPAIVKPLERKIVGIVQLWQAKDKIAHIRKAVTISHHLFAKKLETYGVPAFSYLLLFAVSVFLMVYAMLHLNEKRNHLLLALALTTTGFWIWHIFLCVSLLIKYTLYPLFMSFFLILYWLSISRYFWLAPISMIFWIMLGPPAARYEVYRFYSFNHEVDLYREHLEAVVDELAHSGRYDSRAPLAACGWVTMPWPLEYLLPRSDNFVDCYSRIANAMVRDLQSGDYRWRDDIDLSFTLVIEKMFWALDKLNPDKNAVMLDICGGNQLYDNPDFRIVECSDADIRATIVPAPDSPFLQNRRPPVD